MVGIRYSTFCLLRYSRLFHECIFGFPRSERPELKI
jgi:hypothetical protein